MMILCSVCLKQIMRVLPEHADDGPPYWTHREGREDHQATP